MSSSPCWIPVKPQVSRDLPIAIKYPLAKRYQEHDGSLTGTTQLTKDDIPYLQGLYDAGSVEVSRGAQELIEAIEEHGEILFIIE